MTLRQYSIGITLTATILCAVAPARAQTIKADHTTVEAGAIPDESVAAARALRMSFSHASVGGNIWSGLQALAEDDPAYEFPNWTDNNRGNPGWAAKISEFEAWVDEHAAEYEVFQNKFCYIDPGADFATYRDSMVGLAEQYPEKTFVWWTIPVVTDDGDNPARATFNEQVRDYCAANDVPLFDIADIESHRSDGTGVTASGVEALDPDQSSDGGHLNELGASRAAQAQWALMAQIAGWNDGSPSGSGGGGSETQNPGSTGGSSSAGDDPAGESPSGKNDKGCQFAVAPGTSGATLAAWAVLAMVMLRRCRRRQIRGATNP